MLAWRAFSPLEYFPFKSIHVLQRISCFVALSNAKPPGGVAANFGKSAQSALAALPCQILNWRVKHGPGGTAAQLFNWRQRRSIV